MSDPAEDPKQKIHVVDRDRFADIISRMLVKIMILTRPMMASMRSKNSAISYLAKPFGPTDLQTRIQSAIEGVGPAPLSSAPTGEDEEGEEDDSAIHHHQQPQRHHRIRIPEPNPRSR